MIDLKPYRSLGHPAYSKQPDSPERRATLTNPKQTDMETNYERTGCLVIGIGTIIFWSLIIWLL